LVLVGCQGGGSGYEGPAPVVEFDSVSMQVRMPLDRYGTSPAEERLLVGARLVEYRNCMTQAGVDPAWLDPDEVIAEALTREELMPDWAFGFWNADYMAENGFEGPPARQRNAESFSPEHLQAMEDPQSAFSQAWNLCSSAGSVKFAPVDDGMILAKWEVFVQGYRESNDKAEGDGRWKAALKEWSDCLAGKGYPPPGDWAGFVLPEDTPAEVQAKSHVDSAQCSDDMGTARKLAQVEAEYQMVYIAEHEAELSEIQRMARELVAEAEALVEEAGFSW
jgi:hypothetical protein